MLNLVDRAKMTDKAKKKFIKKAILEAKKKPKAKSVSERASKMYGSKK